MGRKKSYLLFAVIYFNTALSNILVAQQTSPFNKMVLLPSDTDYRFIVSGHFHGSSSSISTFPASTLLAGIDILNAQKASFLMSLGDLFLDVNDSYIRNYESSLFGKLKMPLFNAVGNHDLSNGNIYEKKYGESFYFFEYNTELFIVLNTEQNDGSIKGEQLEMFKTALAKSASQKIKHIFIFSHRPVWSEENPKYADLFEGNTRSKFGAPNYKTEIEPLLKETKKEVYWISGSMASGPSSFFYDKDESTGIIFIQTAIRDTSRDAVLIVKSEKGKIAFTGLSLTGESLQPIEKYNVDFWSKNKGPEKSFNYRLLPYLTWLTITHHYFWIGFAIGILLLILLRWFFNKWRKRK